MQSVTKSKRTVLALDDDEINLAILSKTAQDAGYNVKPFGTSDTAWDYLNKNSREIDIIVVDKMMPGMGGVELLGKIKQHKALKHIPVILQTGDVGVAQMREGLEKGAYYYLTKPFSPEMLAAILKSAENECILQDEMISQLASTHKKFITLMQEGDFTLRNVAEARVLASALSQVSGTPEHTARGLAELFFNAIEHGILDIGYQKKHDALLQGRWTQELANRMSNAQHQNREVKVHVKKAGAVYSVTITDPGKGFNWETYLHSTAPLSLNEPSGRGIIIAARLLGSLQYNDKGTEVRCSIGGARSMVVPVVEKNPRPAAAPNQAQNPAA